MEIRPVKPSDRSWICQSVAKHFASARIVSRGVLRHADELSGLVALRDGARCGVLLYEVRAAECEIVVLVSRKPRAGVASELLTAVERLARGAGCRRLWLVTTNDNEAAIQLYENRGWSLKAVHAGAVTEARHLKPEIPLLGHDDVPIRDELEFELLVAGPSA